MRTEELKAPAFELRIPNAETIAAIEESRAIAKPRFDNLTDMFADLESQSS